MEIFPSIVGFRRIALVPAGRSQPSRPNGKALYDTRLIFCHRVGRAMNVGKAKRLFPPPPTPTGILARQGRFPHPGETGISCPGPAVGIGPAPGPLARRADACCARPGTMQAGRLADGHCRRGIGTTAAAHPLSRRLQGGRNGGRPTLPEKERPTQKSTKEAEVTFWPARHG